MVRRVVVDAKVGVTAGGAEVARAVQRDIASDLRGNENRDGAAKRGIRRQFPTVVDGERRGAGRIGKTQGDDLVRAGDALAGRNVPDLAEFLH